MRVVKKCQIELLLFKKKYNISNNTQYFKSIINIYG
jgi:hypothetical protein